MVEEKRVYTVDEAARLLGICRALAYRQIRNGTIPSIKLGDRYLVPKAALLKMLESATGGLPAH